MKQLFNDQAIKRTLVRISHEILEKNKGCEDLVLIGIVTRGNYLCQRIAKQIKAIEKIDVPYGCIDVTKYRDDRKEPVINDLSDIPFSVEDKKVILVDDVLFRGRTVRAAMEGIMQLGRPKEIQLVVFIDRGHRQLPIRADYVGKNIPTGLHETIEVHLSEIDKEDSVWIKELKENEDAKDK